MVLSFIVRDPDIASLFARILLFDSLGFLCPINTVYRVMLWTLILFFSGLCLAASCQGQDSSGPLVRYAINFTIEDYETHRVLTVQRTSRHSGRIYQYALIRQGGAVPTLPENVTVIRTPVARVVALETVYIGYLEALQQLEALEAVASADYISHPAIRNKVAQGQIQTVETGQAIDLEQLLLLQPDLILSSISGDANFDMPPKLERSGLPLVLTAGYMEPHPLARAEWIKFIAAFFEQDEWAQVLFDSMEARYLKLTHLTKDLEHRPSVFCGAPYSGVWHVPGGASFTARLIEDAGGDYLWSEDRSQGGLPLDTERVFLKAAQADFWINPSHYRNMSALLGADRHFSRFAAARRGKVFNHTRQMSPGGGNAIWERGVTRPDEILADLIHIFHPEQLPQHELIYYEHLK